MRFEIMHMHKSANAGLYDIPQLHRASKRYTLVGKPGAGRAWTLSHILLKATGLSSEGGDLRIIYEDEAIDKENDLVTPINCNEVFTASTSTQMHVLAPIAHVPKDNKAIVLAASAQILQSTWLNLQVVMVVNKLIL